VHKASAFVHLNFYAMKTKIPEVTKTKRTSNWLYYLLIGFVFVFLFTRIFDEKLNLGGDNAAYYILSKAIASAQGYTNIQLPDPTPHTHFPPGYPLLLAIASWLGFSSIVSLKVFTGLTLLGSSLLLFALAQKLTGQKILALLAACLFMSNYHVLYYSTIMMSEVPFIFFSLLAIWLYLRILEKDKPFIRRGAFWWFLIVLVFAFHIRTAGIALFFGFLLDMLLKRRGSLSLATFLFFLGGAIPWMLRNQHYGGSSYLRQLLMINPYKPENGQLATIGDWLARVGNNLNRYFAHEIPSAFYPNYTVDYYSEVSHQYAWIGILVMALSIFGLLKLPSHRRFLASYLGATAGILLLWPDAWFGTRFMLPVLPIVVLLALHGITQLFAKAYPNKPRISALLLLPLFLVYWPKVKELQAIAQQPYLPEYQTYFQAAKWAKKNTDFDIVIATRKPNLFYIFSERACVSYPYIFDHTLFLDSLESIGVNHVVLEQLGYSSGIRYLYPAIAANREKFAMLYETAKPETYLFRFHNAFGYRGEWRIDTPEGEYQDPVIGIKEGQGTYVFSDGSTYEGQWKNDKRNGFGIMKYADGSRFEGFWLENKEHGKGEMYDVSGNFIDSGIWENGEFIRPG
jgi:4-amino-4-deoxy-L-arabinose transferase-like glycosyltransferase